MRYFQWAVIGKLFRTAALKSLESAAFKDYSAQKHWYFLAGAHGQAPSLVIALESRRLEPSRLRVSAIDSSQEFSQNMQTLFANSQFDFAIDSLSHWLRGRREFATFVESYDKLKTDDIDLALYNCLTAHYSANGKTANPVGGIRLEWPDEDLRSFRAIGGAFTHREAL